MSAPADHLQSLGEIFCKNQQVKKACALGVVVDCTAAYRHDETKDFVRKIKIIDVTLNPETPVQGTGVCTVMFFGKTVEELPAPTKIGQILYLRRFDFNVWNNQFQAKKTSPSNIASWILFSGDAKQSSFAELQTSRENISLSDPKFTHLISPLNEIRLFAKDFLSNNSVLPSLPAGKDIDLVLKVKESLNSEYVLTNGERDFQITIDRLIKVNTVVKVRSIDRIENNKKLVPNNYTYVLELEPWTEKLNPLSFTSAPQHAGKQFVTLQELKKLAPQPVKSTVFAKVEVVDILPKTFKDCIHNYNIATNTFSAVSSSSTQAVYNLRFLLKDHTIQNNELLDSYLFSWDGRGSDFVKNVNIKELDKSSLKLESQLFDERVDNLLENSNPENLVEVEIEVSWKANTPMYRILNIGHL